MAGLVLPRSSSYYSGNTEFQVEDLQGPDPKLSKAGFPIVGCQTIQSPVLCVVVATLRKSIGTNKVVLQTFTILIKGTMATAGDVGKRPQLSLADP